MKREMKGDKPSFIIVGAGPAGLVIGTLLSRSGYPTVLLEREALPFRPVCGEYLSPQGVDYLEKLGLFPSIDGFRAVLGMRLTSPAGRSVLARFPDKRFGLALNRQEFQSRLAGLYLEAGGRLCSGEYLTSIKEEYREIEVVTNLRTIKCDALIGADGRLSPVARLSGMEVIPENNRRVAVHCYLEPRTPLSHHGQMHILADGSYAGINPISEKEVNFSIVTDVALLKKAGSAKNLVNRQIALHPALAGSFRPITDERVKTTFPISCHRERISTRRIALIGDASGFIDPLTGEGITTAIKTAALLAEKIRTESSLEAAFAAYERSRKTDFHEKEALNRVLQRVIRLPALCEAIAILLRASPMFRSLFIGVIGNIYTPSEAVKTAIHKLFFFRRKTLWPE